MTRSKTALFLGLFTICAPPAFAGDWTNAAQYNGYGALSQNQASNFSMRDANGNLTVVNGQVVPSIFNQSSGAQYTGSGVGMNTPTTYGQAAAIGNQLSVTVIGSHNTTIIDSTQTNNGNQTANADISAH
ncbi:MAG TPA: holdfast anchoring protein HfaA [Rhizomicrobium sp.]|nr:holdfast anchoring protein HfaA [Rhizomicrobium sp.]